MCFAGTVKRGVSIIEQLLSTVGSSTPVPESPIRVEPVLHRKTLSASIALHCYLMQDKFFSAILQRATVIMLVNVR